jgi:hypothetical protein
MQQTVKPSVDWGPAWGRIRLNEEMARETYAGLQMLLRAYWGVHNGLPNPSPDSYATLIKIRSIEKVVENLEGLAQEKGWTISSPPP